MVIAHIQAAFSIADRHQGAEADGTSAVSGPDSRAALAVVEARVAIGVAVRGIRVRYEQPLVQIDRWGHGVRGWLVRLWVRPGEREGYGSIAMFAAECEAKRSFCSRRRPSTLPTRWPSRPCWTTSRIC